MKSKQKSSANGSNKALELYLKEIGKIPLVSKQEEIELARKAKKGDQQALKRLIEGNLRFVVSIAKKDSNTRLTLLDLINEGNLGLIEATKHYDPDKGVKFVTYAVWWIRQSILQAIALHGYPVKLPLKRANLRQRIRMNEQHLKQKYGRKPDFSEVADSLDEEEKNIENVLRATRVCLSLEVLTLEDEKKNLKILSQLAQEYDVEGEMVSKILSDEICRLLDMLSPREAEVIHLHFGLNHNDGKLTLEEIGKRYGITKEGVRQIEKKATLKLRTHCESVKT